MGDERSSRGLPSLKIWKKSNKKWGRCRGPKMGFQIADKSYVQMNGKTLDADNENLPFRHVHFLPILQANG